MLGKFIRELPGRASERFEKAQYNVVQREQSRLNRDNQEIVRPRR